MHAVGGLAETVHDVDGDGASGNGFSFSTYKPEAFADAIDRAMTRFRADRWRDLVQRVMREDHSWTASATRYVDVYKKAVRRRRSA